jgi:hypothetical protein
MMSYRLYYVAIGRLVKGRLVDRAEDGIDMYPGSLAAEPKYLISANVRLTYNSMLPHRKPIIPRPRS